jgi:hypothetical protein
MPQARSGGSRRSGSGTGSRRAGASSTKSSRSGSTSRSRSSSASSRARSSKAGTRKSTGRSRSTRTTASTTDASFEAAAQRLRRLNERIIKAGKEAGETTLTSYEKALRTMASALERGPGSSDVEWVSNLATAQAKFIRDVTTSWTSAARKMLK